MSILDGVEALAKLMRSKWFIHAELNSSWSRKTSEILNCCQSSYGQFRFDTPLTQAWNWYPSSRSDKSVIAITDHIRTFLTKIQASSNG